MRVGTAVGAGLQRDKFLERPLLGGTFQPQVRPWQTESVGESRKSPAHLIEFVPTALEVAGIEKPREWMGEPIPPAPWKSLVPGFRTDSVIPRESPLWLHDGNRAVRVGDWKLVAARGNPWELYDITNDRADQKNLAAELPCKVAEMEKVWQGQVSDFTELAQKTMAEQPKAEKRKAAH